METEDLPQFSCICGKVFERHSAFSNHIRCCPRSKYRLSQALAVTKLRWKEKLEERARKRSKSDTTPTPTVDDAGPSGPPSSLVEPLPSPVGAGSTISQGNKKVTGNREANLHLPIALRKEPRACTKTKPHQDTAPAPLTPLSRRNTIPSDLNSGTTSIQADNDSPGVPAVGSADKAIRDRERASFSSRNEFSMYRKYWSTSEEPSHDPEMQLTSNDRSDVAPLPSSKILVHNANPYTPYPNRSSFLLGEWFWCSKTKSLNDFDGLMKVLSDTDFSLSDVQSTHWEKLNRDLGGGMLHSNKTPDLFPANCISPLDPRWIREPVWINVPFVRGTVDPGVKTYLVGHLYRRSIISILRDRLSSPDSQHFHLNPEEIYWQPDVSQPAQRVHGEIYNSHKFVEEHWKLQSLPKEPDCTLPRVVAALIFASDETHLTQFGNTKLYPLYMYFGNDSKYMRAQPSKHLCNHLAYFVKLPNDFREYYRQHSGDKAPGQNVVPHCLREALHTQWGYILDDEFVEAYKHGCVIQCLFDGRKRRFYPRIFAISADYPEKVVLTGIRGINAERPCPRCLIPKDQIANMGMPRDRWWRSKRKRVDNANYRQNIKDAQDAIYKKTYAIKSDVVENLLKPDSLTPSQNAFSNRLSMLGFDFFDVMPVDLMHEIESGTWESLFTHLLRIVNSVGGHLLDVLDFRYRQTPAFGKDAIRKFRRNLTGLGHMATREWEDLLQCAIPVFEGLILGPNNAKILRLLYVFATWHGIAKLRIHTDQTLLLLDHLTMDIGKLMRDFRLKLCPQYKTKELAKETQNRHRQGVRRKQQSSRTQPKKAKKPQKAKSGRRNTRSQTRTQATASNQDNLDDSEARPKTMSLLTYKFHSMGDYVGTIKSLGTVDSYSTALSELEHRTPKSQYSRTSKKNFVEQITQIERRQARIRRIRGTLEQVSLSQSQDGTVTDPSYNKEADALRRRYLIGTSETESTHIGHFLQQNSGDPAISGFLEELKTHVLQRVSECATLKERATDSSIFFQRDRLYTHRVLRVNYTTYDVRRAQDIINPSSGQCNVMLLRDPGHGSEGDSTGISGQTHPFIYAKVLKIFHVNVIFSTGDPAPHRLDCLWVRWYQYQEPTPSHGLHRVKLVNISSDNACGFINPAEIIRGCHIVPAFAKGKVFPDGHHGSSRLVLDKDDWQEYYISQFADRDLLMRFYWGMAIGHTYTHSQSPFQPSPISEQGADIDDVVYTAADAREELGSELQLGEEFGRGDDEVDCGEKDGAADSDASDDDLNDQEFADKHNLIL